PSTTSTSGSSSTTGIPAGTLGTTGTTAAPGTPDIPSTTSTSGSSSTTGIPAGTLGTTGTTAAPGTPGAPRAATGPRGPIAPRDEVVWVVLTGGLGRGELLELFGSGDEGVVAAAAHRLLPGEARAVVASVDAGSTTGRLLAAAGAVTELDAVEDAAVLDAVGELIGRLAESAGTVPPDRGQGGVDGPGRMEVLAALVGAVFAIDRGRGVRLALRTGRVLEREGVPGRLTWPWAVAFGRAAGALGDLVALAESGTDLEAAIFGLSSSAGFLLDAAPGPEHRLGERARARFLATPAPAADGPDAWRYVMAAATVGLTAVLPYARELASRPGYGTVPVLTGTGSYGLLEQTDLAGVLAAIGHLARLTASQGATAPAPPRSHPEVAAAHALLRDFPVEGAHPGVAAGRLAGLAYLGDWQAVLVGFTRDDPRLARIAERAVHVWLPGPPSARASTLREVARWIAAHLRAATGLPPGVRAVLTDLQRDCEHAVEAFVPQP
ncbi:hypothetical protein ACFP1K_10770, partial [Sphaerisporangium aureirubrum]